MSEGTAAAKPSVGVYWRTWTFLLVLTAIMFFLDSLSMARTPFVLIMVFAMLVKATLIAGIFMHLKQESLDLAITMAVTVLGLAALLYGLIVVDAFRILAMITG